MHSGPPPGGAGGEGSAPCGESPPPGGAGGILGAIGATGGGHGTADLSAHPACGHLSLVRKALETLVHDFDFLVHVDMEEDDDLFPTSDHHWVAKLSRSVKPSLKGDLFVRT